MMKTLAPAASISIMPAQHQKNAHPTRYRIATIAQIFSAITLGSVIGLSVGCSSAEESTDNAEDDLQVMKIIGPLLYDQRLLNIEIGAANKFIAYSFEGTAGDEVFVSSVWREFGKTPSVMILDDKKVKLASAIASPDSSGLGVSARLTRTGTYYVAVKRSGAAAYLNMTLSKLIPPMHSLWVGVVTSCARARNGEIRCWGANYNGNLTDGTRLSRATAVPLNGLDANKVADLAMGIEYGCALMTDHSVKCWGDSGQVGPINPQWSLPKTVSLPDRVLAIDNRYHDPLRQTSPYNSGISVGLFNGSGVELFGSSPILDATTTCTLTAGVVSCQGFDWAASKWETTPKPVLGLSGVSELAVGGVHQCARLVSGEVRCWGYSVDGRVGDGNPNSHSVVIPTKVLGLD
jgi:hypothetical protein